MIVSPRPPAGGFFLDTAVFAFYHAGMIDKRPGSEKKTKQCPCRTYLCDPFLIFAAAMFLAFLLYLLRWSDLFPAVQPMSILFVAFTCLVFTLFGFINRKRLVKISECASGEPSDRALLLGTGGVLLIYGLELIANRKIPLMDLLHPDRIQEYRKFRAFPFFHYFAFAAGLFLVAVLFKRYLDQRERKHLYLIGLNLIPYLLYFKRAAFVLLGIQWLFYYLARRREMPWKNLLWGGLALLLGAYLFGLAGEYRERGKGRTLEGVSRINDDFPDILPREMVWSYMYAASPMANLMKNLGEPSPGHLDYPGLVAFEFLPAKARMSRLWRWLGLQERDPLRIAKSFNVSTNFAGPYAYAGWWGIGLMMVLMLLVLSWGIRLIGSPSPYSLIMLSLMCTFSVLSLFSNMFSFTPMFLLLFGGFALHRFTFRRAHQIASADSD